jgi:SAM-dependent methyltransferase
MGLAEERRAATQKAWDTYTRAVNAAKGDQAAFLRGGGDTVFPEELALLGPLAGGTLLHLQCNAGQDSLCLARRGAQVTGIDFSNEAISFARGLSEQTGIRARFLEAEVNAWLDRTEERFDTVFCSYGALNWHEDLVAFFQNVARVLKPGGAFVTVEHHPLVFSLGNEGVFNGVDYFASGPYAELIDGNANQPMPHTTPVETVAVIPEVAYRFQHPLGEVLDAVARSGLKLERCAEYSFSNGRKPASGFLLGEGRRWLWPDGKPKLPLMYGLRAALR